MRNQTIRSGLAARVVLLGALLGLSLDAVAGPYLGAAGLYAKYRSEDLDYATGSKYFAGYRFSEMPLLVEATYLDLGEADVDGMPDTDLNFTGYQLSIGYFDRFDERSDSGFWAKLGYYAGDAELRGSGGVIDSRSSNGFSLGFGADWMFLPFMGLRLELDDLFQVRDFGGDSNAVSVSLGVVIEIPVGRKPRRAAAVLTAPAAPVPAAEFVPPATEEPVRFFELEAETAAAVPSPAPASVPPVAVETESAVEPPPAPEPEPAPTPVASAPAPSAPAPQSVAPPPVEPAAVESPPETMPEAPPSPDSAPAVPTPPLASVPVPPPSPRLRMATPLRRQPRPDAIEEIAIPRGAEVLVHGRVTNQHGHWRYVEYRDLTGWVPVDALVEP